MLTFFKGMCIDLGIDGRLILKWIWGNMTVLITVAIFFEVHTVFHCWDCGFESSYSMVHVVVGKCLVG